MSIFSQSSPEKQNQQEVCVFVFYYEELAHMIMEADKPQDLWGELAS